MDTSRVYTILEKIDPSIRQRKLEEEVKILEDRFISYYYSADAQSKLAENYDREYAAWKAANGGDTGVQDPARESHLRQVRMELMRQEVSLETVGDLLEEQKALLEGMQRAGLPAR